MPLEHLASQFKVILSARFGEQSLLQTVPSRNQFTGHTETQESVLGSP